MNPKDSAVKLLVSSWSVSHHGDNEGEHYRYAWISDVIGGKHTIRVGYQPGSDHFNVTVTDDRLGQSPGHVEAAEGDTGTEIRARATAVLLNVAQRCLADACGAWESS